MYGVTNLIEITMYLKLSVAIKLDNMSVIPDGEIVAFWTQWSGKTTTLKMITGILERDSGSIKINELIL